ncbi:DNA cytosine methyltransferase [Janthinobacterium sp. HLS12-2]|uniref:DNA cytosine methyltransferase n=1 Tax=Janthinobacterium sp. HLS12-2 TaxID=1259324 RepID=UPI003F259CB4
MVSKEKNEIKAPQDLKNLNDSGAVWKTHSNLRIASLFAGTGGLDLGFIHAGHKVVWANDFQPDSALSYKKNIGDHIVCGDISDIHASEVPEIDLLAGGLPCQGFSNANVNKIDNDSRNDLYAQFVRILLSKLPKFFVIENVRGMLSLHGGAAFEKILLALDEAGYETQYKVLNAADYGVPQTRIRLFVIGIRKDLTETYRYTFPEPTHSRFPEKTGLKPWVTVAEALKNIPEPDEPSNLLNHICSNYKITNRNFTGHRTTDPNKPSPTILARGNAGGGVCAIQHPNNHRRMSVRESAIIQTFPIDFEFVGKTNSMYRQVGNAVPVLLAKCVAQGFERIG